MNDHDVIVIGTGPVGSCTTYEVARRGCGVALIDSEGFGSGAARKNAGWITPIMAAPVPAPGVVMKAVRWMFDPTSPLRVAPDFDPGHVTFMLGMLRASTPRRFHDGLMAVSQLAAGTLELFREYRSAGVDFELHEDGVLMAFLSEKDCLDHMSEYEHAATFGLQPPRLVGAGEMHDMEPALTDQVIAGALCPDQMHVDPASLVDGLAQKLVEMGITTSLNDPVLSLTQRDGFVELRTQSKTYRARDVVLAAGVGSAALAASAGQRLPVRFGKGYGFDMSVPHLNLGRAVYLSEAKVAVSPTNRGVRFAGTMEFGGDPKSVDMRRARGIIESSRRYFSVDLGEAPTPWTGLRPMTPDGLPVIGRLSKAPNVIVATGHAMLGVTLGPRTGALVADLIQGEEPPVLTPFSPDRF